MPRKRGFTLIELLVVIGIIGILISILIPVIGRVRQSGMKTACAAQLRDVGNFLQMYLNDNRQRVPRVHPLPSLRGITMRELDNAPSIVQVLEPYHKGAAKVFRCPADRIVNEVADPNVQVTDSTYFEREGSSFEYNVFFNAFAYDEITGINKTWRDALADAERTRGATPDRVTIFNDFDPFHGKVGDAKSRNYLTADWSVKDERPQGYRSRGSSGVRN